MKHLGIALLLIGLLTALPARAQDAATCDWEAAVTDATEQLTAATAEDAGAVLAAVATALGQASAACNELVFEGAGGRVLGPIELDAGLYRAVVETEGYFIADVTVIEGECGAGIMGLFNETPNDTGQHEALLESAGCTAVVEVSNAREAWTLRFEKLG